MKFQLTNRQIEEAPRQNIPLIFRNPHILHMKHFMLNVTFDITISESGHLKPKTYLLSNSLLTKSTIGLDMKIKYRVNRLKQNRTVDVFFFLARYTICPLYLSGPPSRLVLWWISFQVTTPSFPVVLDTPIVNTSLCLKACSSKWRTSWPSLLSGRYACRSIPINGSPGSG